MIDIQDAVKLIVYKCRERSHPISEALAAYIAHTTLNPKSGRFYLEEPLKYETDAMALVNAAVDRLTAPPDVSLKTQMMQITYDAAYVQQEYYRQHFSSIQSQETNALIDDIVNCETKSGIDFEGITLLYKRIFSFLLFRNKQLSVNFANVIVKPAGGASTMAVIANSILKPNIPISVLNTIEREIAAALESVLPRAGLRPFVALGTPEKVSQLLELSNIVIGIRLFNKEIGKGGVGLESFEQIVAHPSRDLISLLNYEVSNTAAVCEDYTRVFTIKPRDTRITEENLNAWRDELTHRRQLLSYLLALHEDVLTAEANIGNLHSRYLREIMELKEMIGNKTSIPKDQVYPKFDSLCQVYTSMSEEINLTILRKELFKLLDDSKNQVTCTMPEDLILHVRSLGESRSQEAFDEPISMPSDVQRLTQENSPEFMHTPLDYQGFCPWSVVKQNGVIVPGNPNLGVIRFRDHHFVFSSSAALAEFVANPQAIIDSAILKARERPELIHLLRLGDDFPSCSLTHVLQGREGNPLFSVTAALMVDEGINTPVHFVESYIDRKYHWNEWELRRRALQMADIRKRQTTSVQTNLSHYRRDNETQVYLPKAEETQTGINAGTTMDRPRIYNVGMRDSRVK
mmetsp:Transcript_9817/g.19340  ORF Transcript_9817/g.19340 Transcript_9817/m.19340 type:complete len:631 (+) Transcript_9817:1239-3131(+)|eukprot:CAMPEP_0204915094 /NCGR_PEP_ID=MMETSP1397-20131031/13106_1 /ASSEMBLY_ACC=CAM_ASM_000891 /TAXON_ID=49980 /ORGANISM="Climacostomum Climacostomum virens, Strain Stock W-24" /LENGTH=630 /DNA_ID=CAMNT_0052086975 /DNA_START=504 /DNA_END=2396 /DNA_ORIENTATION=-